MTNAVKAVRGGRAEVGGSSRGSRTPAEVCLRGGPPERLEDAWVSGSGSFSAKSWLIKLSLTADDVRCPRSSEERRGSRPTGICLGTGRESLTFLARAGNRILKS